ncbi:MAG: hypothetical protein M1834_006716 [Cirrosporium novae-zelandiae]|nr:MAG: hypothetical protein M1834_006716 [Cirrosporium novae-zelandiae]
MDPGFPDPEASIKKKASLVPSEPSFLVGEVEPINHHAERALCRKFDFRILPVLALMYLFNSLDKSNMGNAKTNGLEEDIGLQGSQYNIMLSVFYVPYVVFAPPIMMLGKKYGPSRVLPILMFCFGSITLFITAVRNFGGLCALRMLLGLAEGAFFPLVIYYQTMFYRRAELARRLAIFYAASNIASAFSGLLAFGVFRINSGALASWRYLFVIEGACTVLFSMFAFWYLPRSASEARFLNEEEKQLAFHRIQIDSSAIVNEKFNLRESFSIFKDFTTYIFLLLEICLGVPATSVSNFLPQIIARLGYSTVKTNLYTVAPNVSGAVVLLLLAYPSDLLRMRFPFIALGFLLTFIGFMIYVAIDVEKQLHVAYFATFMMCWGTSAPVTLVSVWYSNNIAHEGRRVVLTSIGVPLANLMGLVSSNIFQDKDAPKYIPALATTAAFGAFGVSLTACLGIWMMWDNQRRNRVQGMKLRASEAPTERLREGPKSEEFRWFI